MLPSRDQAWLAALDARLQARKPLAEPITGDQEKITFLLDALERMINACPICDGAGVVSVRYLHDKVQRKVVMLPEEALQLCEYCTEYREALYRASR